MMSTLFLVSMASTLKWKAVMFTVGVTGNLLFIGGSAFYAKELFIKIQDKLSASPDTLVRFTHNYELEPS